MKKMKKEIIMDKENFIINKVIKYKMKSFLKI
jgi:hypothetical protein